MAIDEKIAAERLQSVVDSVNDSNKPIDYIEIQNKIREIMSELSIGQSNGKPKILQ